jgi:hypothetical protein
MIRFAFILLIILSILTGSCTSRKNKLDKKNLIPEKELISLLTDIHIADGLLELPSVNKWASALDSISSYYQVIEKHGYTKETMDKTMKYYFLKEPKKLNKIYDQVLGILSEMEARAGKDFSLEKTRISNLWKGKDFYASPSLSDYDSTKFDMTLYKKGVYTLSFTATVFPDDQSVRTSATGMISSPDSIETVSNKYEKTIYFLKDGRPHNYYLNFFVFKYPVSHLSGWFYDFDNRSYGLIRHFIIENISLRFNNAGV